MKASQFSCNLAVLFPLGYTIDVSVIKSYWNPEYKSMCLQFKESYISRKDLDNSCIWALLWKIYL